MSKSKITSTHKNASIVQTLFDLFECYHLSSFPFIPFNKHFCIQSNPSIQSVRIRVSDPSDLHFLPFFRSVFFYISFVFGIKPDVPVESPGCKLQFDTPFMGFHWFFVSHKMVGRKKLSKISNMPLFDLDQILIQCVPLPSVVISEVIWLATHL